MTLPTAQLVWLIGAIVAAVAAVLAFLRHDVEHGLGWLAAACIALGLAIQ